MRGILCYTLDRKTVPAQRRFVPTYESPMPSATLGGLVQRMLCEIHATHLAREGLLDRSVLLLPEVAPVVEVM
jgi:hypothetical protein